ncbi:MAG: hypothetical protein ACJ76H_04685 [Bacteriovoracaceae bacterium]
MEFKKAICRLWGHEFVAVPSSFSSQNEGLDYLCRRCGHEKFSPSGTWEKINAAPERNVDISFVQKRSEISREFR